MNCYRVKITWFYLQTSQMLELGKSGTYNMHIACRIKELTDFKYTLIFL